MKKLALLFIAFLCVQFTSFAQSGWVQQTSGTTTSLTGVSFSDANFGMAVGQDLILGTTNGGVSWLQQQLNSAVNDIFLLDSNLGFIASYGVILCSTDGGVNWLEQQLPLFIGCGKLFFLNEDIGFAVGGFEELQRYGWIFKTTDGGTTWNVLAEPSTPNWEDFSPLDVFFTDANTGTVVGSGRILRTSDGGVTWEDQFTATLNSVFFTDMLTGTAVGWYNTILRTTDGGTTWLQQDGGTPPQMQFNGVCFTDVNNGWVVGLDGTILRTTDGGTNWIQQVSGTTEQLFDVCFMNSDIGTVTGNQGVILRTTTGGVVSVEEEISGIPDKYNLTQNYPNPFNPSTKIRYSIPHISKVVIKVFNILGDDIETLVNEEKPSGTYELTWNAEDLPSGVYFYQIQAGSFIDTKKMILLR